MWHQYRQTNSGGSFDISDDLGHTVLIEADSPDDANQRATELGIYFDGCEDGSDCSCCGDRWYRASDPGTPEPTIYETPVADYKPLTYWGEGGTYTIDLHFKDGRHERKVLKDPKKG